MSIKICGFMRKADCNACIEISFAWEEPLIARCKGCFANAAKLSLMRVTRNSKSDARECPKYGNSPHRCVNPPQSHGFPENQNLFFL